MKKALVMQRFPLIRRHFVGKSQPIHSRSRVTQLTGMSIIFCLLILPSFTSAIFTDLKENYEKGETLIVEIIGNVLEDISPSQVDFRRGHVSVPFDYDVRKIGDRHFIWAIAPEKENNYTLVISDILTTVSGRREIINFEQNFSVSENLTAYSIKPGFIIASRDFNLLIQLNEDSDTEIDTDFPEEGKIILNPGENIISFPLRDINESEFLMIKVGKYSIPAFIIFKDVRDYEGKWAKKHILKTNPESIKSTLLKGNNAAYPFQIINGPEGAERIILEYDKELFYFPEEEIILDAEEAIELNMSFIGNSSDAINETIIIRAGDYSINLPVEIAFTEKNEEVETPYLKDYESAPYCSELNGKICTAGEKCTGESKPSLDGACCLASCQKEQAGETPPWIGYLIAGIILAIIIFVFFKYRKTKGANGFARTLAAAEKKFP